MSDLNKYVESKEKERYVDILKGIDMTMKQRSSLVDQISYEDIKAENINQNPLQNVKSFNNSSQDFMIESV